MKSRDWLARSKRCCDEMTVLHRELRLLWRLESKAIAANSNAMVQAIQAEMATKQRYFDGLAAAHRKLMAKGWRKTA